MLPQQNQNNSISGALLIHKPAGLTSFGVVKALKKYFPRGTKIGHGGTLDPFATGLLVILVGRSTRLAQYFLGSDKYYEGSIQFGMTTDTGDPTGKTIGTTDVVPESLETIQRAAQEFTQHPYEQLPPMFSAKKHQGKPLYKFARAGIEIERKTKLCELKTFEILSYAKPIATFKLHCTSGTYARTLAEDFAKTMGSQGVLASLCRTGSGTWNIEPAQTLEQMGALAAAGVSIPSSPGWIPYHSLLARVERDGRGSANGTIRGPAGDAHSSVRV